MKIKNSLKTKDDFVQYEFLNTPININKSGYIRYGAAMYFFNKGLISEETLEVYRICCKFDHYNPKDLLKS
tara:strand:+ start:810 stop:1022 length:213 start_codon:yes stop_codon:yes gene_type:complete